jgi:hypothetical protein
MKTDPSMMQVDEVPPLKSHGQNRTDMIWCPVTTMHYDMSLLLKTKFEVTENISCLLSQYHCIFDRLFHSTGDRAK